MAIVSMQKLSICANKKNRKAILETLQELGIVEIFTDGIEDEDLHVTDTQRARAKYEKRAESYDRVLKLLDTYSPGKKSGGLFGGLDEIKKADVEKIVKNRRQYNEDTVRKMVFAQGAPRSLSGRSPSPPRASHSMQLPRRTSRSRCPSAPR